MNLVGIRSFKLFFSRIETVSSLWIEINCHWCLVQVTPGMLSVFSRQRQGKSIEHCFGLSGVFYRKTGEQQVNSAY